MQIRVRRTRQNVAVGDAESAHSVVARSRDAAGCRATAAAATPADAREAVRGELRETQQYLVLPLRPRSIGPGRSSPSNSKPDTRSDVVAWTW